ncbi:unnamed protein product [Mytilus coruscus]|uniref:Uncharacterized protein n=1 Tax=Mytilus coruscus TaxID=42192 RepID=A0A6J8E9T4_MYTCO|nr:unnamed protein product [Mytilus coruscus]
MPQVHNKSILLDGNAFGKNSRFMNTMKFSDITKRRVRAFNVVENRLSKYRINYYNRQAEIEFNRVQKQKETLLVRMKKLMAYKVVAKHHNISNAQDYHAALNEDRSPRKIQKEIKEMIKQISPQYVREKRAREKIDEARRLCDDVIHQNRKQIDVIYPPPKQWQPYREQDEDDSRSNVTTPQSAPPEMNAEMRMRRLTLPQNRRTVGVSRAYVMEKSNLGEKLEKEKTVMEIPPQKEMLVSETETNDKELKSDLPPVIVRRSSLKDEALPKQKAKRLEKPNYELAPVSLNKKIKKELDIRSD